MMNREHTERVKASLRALQEVEESIPHIGLRMLSVDEGKLYPVDLLAKGALKRALSLSAAFRLLIEHWNLVAARALLRLQIDTAARFSAVWLVDDPHQFACYVLAGSRIDRIKDRDGKLLQDRYLVERLGEEHEWVPRVYEIACGYVHLSERHLFSATVDVQEEDRTISFCIGPDDSHMPEFSFLEAVDCFRETTEIFLRYVEGWTVTKDHPELLAKLRARQNEKEKDAQQAPCSRPPNVGG